jgi:hypothetical protein
LHQPLVSPVSLVHGTYKLRIDTKESFQMYEQQFSLAQGNKYHNNQERLNSFGNSRSKNSIVDAG